MTVSSTVNRNDYVGNGATTVYPYTFQIFDQTHIEVWVQTVGGTVSKLTLTTDYTVSGVNLSGGGNITLTTALTSGYLIAVKLVLPLTQLTDLKNQGQFFGEVHERVFDRDIRIAQQLADQYARGIKLPETEIGSTLKTTIPSVSQRASKLLGFDENGNPTSMSFSYSSDVTVNNIASLMLIVGDGSKIAKTQGYDAAGDGGENSFYWDAASTATHNGGTVIKPTSVIGAGRWLAVNTDTVSIAQFGAVAGNSTPQQSFINSAATYCRNTNKKLFLGIGDYRVTAECDLSDIQYIDGSQSFLIAENGAYAAVKIGGSSNTFKDADIYVRVKNLSDLSSTSGNLGIKLLSINNSKMRIYARGFNTGLYFDGTTALRVYVGNQITVDQLYNNGNQVHFDMSGNSYAVKNQFLGGSYYIGTNQKVAGRGTVKLTLAGSGLVSDTLFMSSEITVNGGSYDADQAVMVYADLNTTWAINTIEFKDCRYEGNGTFATDPIAVKINTTTAGRLGVTVELSGSVDASTLQVSVPQSKFNRVIMKQANSRPSDTAFPQFIQPTKTIPYQTNARCYVPNRVLYNGAAGFNVSAEYFTGFGTNTANRAIGDGDCVVGQGDITYGLVYSKTVGTCTHIEMSQETNFTVVCFDANGIVLSGTAPYYAVGAGFRSTTRGSVGCYEFDGKWLWLHKDVAKFYIGGSRWSSNGVIPDLSFFVNFGRNIVIDNTVQKSAPNMVSHSSGIQSYFPVGMALDGTASNGYRTTFYLSTTVLNAAVSTAVTIDAVNVTGIAINDLIGIELDTAIATGFNRYHHTIVSGIAGNTLTLTAALPANVAIGRKILVNRWVAR